MRLPWKRRHPECDEPTSLDLKPLPRWVVGESEIGWGVYDRETGDECSKSQQHWYPEDAQAEANYMNSVEATGPRPDPQPHDDRPDGRHAMRLLSVLTSTLYAAVAVLYATQGQAFLTAIWSAGAAAWALSAYWQSRRL